MQTGRVTGATNHTRLREPASVRWRYSGQRSKCRSGQLAAETAVAETDVPMQLAPHSIGRAQRMLQVALESEVEDFLQAHAHRVDERRRRLGRNQEKETRKNAQGGARPICLSAEQRTWITRRRGIEGFEELKGSYSPTHPSEGAREPGLRPRGLRTSVPSATPYAFPPVWLSVRSLRCPYSFYTPIPRSFGRSSPR